MPDLSFLFKPPRLFLTLGAISFFGAVVSTCTGKTWARFQGWINRAEEPRQFWGVVAMYLLVGICFIGIFLYQIDGVSN